MIEHKTERYAAGKWFVYTSGQYPVRLGHVCGGNKHYLAEVGPEPLGYFPTVKAAAKAIGERTA